MMDRYIEYLYSINLAIDANNYNLSKYFELFRPSK